MLTGGGPVRHAALTPSQESEGMRAACRTGLCYNTIAVSNWNSRQALTAFCTSRARSSWPCSLYAPRIRSRA
jgi:hypothetical protein